MLCIIRGQNSNLEQSLLGNCIIKMFNLHRFHMLCISRGPNSKLEQPLIDKCISKCLICTGFIFCTFHVG